MARKKVVDYLQENMCVIRGLIKAGLFPMDIISQFQIYSFYVTTSKVKSKMDRYEFTAEQFKVSVSTIRTIVSKMEKTIDV